MRAERKVILISCLMGLCLWFLDTVGDTIVFAEGDWWDSLLFDVSQPHFVMRCVSFVVLLFFCWFLYRTIATAERKSHSVSIRHAKLLSNHKQVIEDNNKLTEKGIVDLRKDHAERVKELQCLYSFSQLVDRKNITLDEIFQGCVDLIPKASQYPDITCARLQFDGKDYQTTNFRMTPWQLSAVVTSDDCAVGELLVCCLQEKPIADEGPFLKEERALLNSLAERISHIAERERALARITTHQEQLRSLASKLSLAEAHERRRVARQVHDDVSQNLALSMLKLNGLRDSITSDELSGELESVVELITEVVQRTRSLTYDLSSPVLHRYGLEKAIAEWSRTELLEKHGITAQVTDDGQPKPLTNDLRELLFQSVRELLVNVIKHAHAKSVQISFKKRFGNIEATVEDDGVGLSEREIGNFGQKGGFGIFSIQERLNYLGGRLEIDSHTGHGTRVALVAPLAPEENGDNLD